MTKPNTRRMSVSGNYIRTQEALSALDKNPDFLKRPLREDASRRNCEIRYYRMLHSGGEIRGFCFVDYLVSWSVRTAARN